MIESNKPLGVGVVGLGVGRKLVESFDSHPLCEVVGVCDHDVELAQEVAEGLRNCSVIDSFEQLVSDPRIEAMAIASYDDDHYEQVMNSLRAGKHVFVEKPLCQNMEELSNIAYQIRSAEARKVLRSNLIMRAAPLYKQIKELIDGGAIGEVFALDGDYLYGRVEKITDGWRGDIENYSVMLGGGIHLVDLILWFANDRPTTAISSGNQIVTRDSRFRSNDFVSTTLEFDSGVVARITANYGGVHPHQHVVRVFGTKATFLIDDCGARLHRTRDPAGEVEWLEAEPHAAHKGLMVPEFVEAVLEGGHAQDNPQWVFDNLSVCAAADRSLATGLRETVRYV